jgi:crotonobetainyl-CoA:carnitine CoA-transferase CaiB-like acyl-CoA transferase
VPDFADVTVVDASESVAGQFCARLFADHGASVWLVEPAAGSVLRGRPGLFAHLNRDKRSVPAHSAAARTLAARADVVIRSRATSTLDPTFERQPNQILCTVSEFGDSGPYAEWVGCELVHQSLSGLAYSTGDPARAPLYGFGERAYYSAGAAAYVSAAAALLERDRSGQGQAVGTSVVETAASMALNLIAQHDYNGTYPARGDYPGPLGVYPCRDGWVAVFVLPGRWTALAGALGLGSMAEDERFTSGAALSANWPAASAILAEAVRGRDRDELVELGQGVRVAIAAVLDVADVVAAAGEADRRYWSRPAPVLPGADRVPETPAPAAPQRRPSPCSALPRPLDGVRVLDLTTAWAGPMTGRSLAYLGAEVIKVETRASIDAWRGAVVGGDVRRYPDLTPGERPYNRSCWFNTQNHDKLSLELDLKQPAGIGAMRRLVERADVVICNLAPGALARLGLDYESLRVLRDDIVLLEITGFDSGGPMARHVGVGPTIEASTGMMSLVGYGDGAPYNTGGAYLDPIGALVATGEVLTALAQRPSRGGRRIEVSLREAALQWMGECLVDVATTGRRATALGNRHPVHYPHDIFAAAGDDEWIAVAVETTAQWVALCAAIGRPDLGADRALATAEGRRAADEQIAPVLSGWFATRDKRHAAARLQALGIPAAPVYSGAEVGDDPQLAALGFVYAMAHPEAGTHRYQGLPYHLARTPGRVERPAPLLGEHTDRVLREIAELPASELEQLYRDGVARQADPSPDAVSGAAT